MNEINNLSKRQPMDKSINQHGHELLDFLIEARFCVLNGRFPYENFTYILKKGKAIVAYICVYLITHHGLSSRMGEIRLRQKCVFLCHNLFFYNATFAPPVLKLRSTICAKNNIRLRQLIEN